MSSNWLIELGPSANLIGCLPNQIGLRIALNSSDHLSQIGPTNCSTDKSRKWNYHAVGGRIRGVSD